jgi:hypothetical protein
MLPRLALLDLYGFAGLAVDDDIAPFLQTAEVCWPANVTDLRLFISQ